MEYVGWKKVFRRAQRELQKEGEPLLSRDEQRWVREQEWQVPTDQDAPGKAASEAVITDMAGMTVDSVLRAREVFSKSARPGEGKPLPPPAEVSQFTVDGPDWWPLSVAQMFSKFERVQRYWLRQLGCCDEHGVVGFLALRDVLPLIDSLAQREEQTGDSTFLYVPYAEDTIDDPDHVGFSFSDLNYADLGRPDDAGH